MHGLASKAINFYVSCLSIWSKFMYHNYWTVTLRWL